MNSGHLPLQEDSGEPFCWILRPTLQLKIKANSSTENWGQLLEWIQAISPTPGRFRWTLLLNFKANSSAEIKANPSAEN